MSTPAPQAAVGRPDGRSNPAPYPAVRLSPSISMRRGRVLGEGGASSTPSVFKPRRASSPFGAESRMYDGSVRRTIVNVAAGVLVQGVGGGGWNRET
jgi:hypothetical protein